VVVVLSIPLVLANGGLGVYLLYDIENYGDDDEECGAAYGECGDTSDALENKRQDGKGAKKECSNERDTGDDVGEILVIICALAAKGNKPAIASPTANFDAFASNIFLFIGFYPVK